ncbi:MAG: ATP-binding protein [Bacillota bacterium]
MKTYSIEFKSTFKEAGFATEKILDFIQTEGEISDKEKLFSINLALRELFANAVEHGNRMDANKRVICEACISRDEFFIHIFDEGEGFELSSCRKKARLQGVLSQRGRGIYIIETLGFHIMVNKNHVMVRFKLDEIK